MIVTITAKRLQPRDQLAYDIIINKPIGGCEHHMALAGKYVIDLLSEVLGKLPFQIFSEEEV